ncbi:dermonecrotic toxin SpeSicTox-betaIIA2iv [Trichonephila inaurata madagascariensis]|uniref:Dermonecrotic toxin SpeSicTox-betaIIA2iv n=1 Tax=Trichonephila inaurata madagascariensis TaxID=2747483 RepID=A0A8X6MA05_9ARAC|nr:dermonecrotic toxin SpeSicTox-betaIIA2iv [Trichonephila inaurata madagascariensis]
MLHILWNFPFIFLIISKYLSASDVILNVEEKEDSRRPIWNIAHMVNAVYQIDYYLDQGANSLEFDIDFDTSGIARFTFHGFPCDCFRNCMHYEDFVTYIKHLQRLTTPDDSLFRQQLVLLFMDFKLNGLSSDSLIRAGKDVAMKLLNHYWKGGNSGGQANVLVSIPSIRQMGFIRSFLTTLQHENASDYESKIGFDFSGNEDVNEIEKGVKRAGIADRVWQGDGITNCLPRGTQRLLNIIDIRDRDLDTYVKKAYWWTVDRQSTMQRVLTFGVDGLITNYPYRLVKVLKENGFSKQARLAVLDDSPWKKYPRRTASFISALLRTSSFNEDAEELLYNC